MRTNEGKRARDRGVVQKTPEIAVLEISRVFVRD